MANRLARETSPYLLQHKDNPVDWYAWGEEAFAAAREADKPVLLSVGYSACHWCHVMAHESFENEAIAGLMNQLFVNIKVDREERPDVDNIYMQAVQSLTGRGGWPMTVFLTPEGVPFYGGTYFPPDDRQGMPGFPRLLHAVAEAYREKRGDIDRAGSDLLQAIGAPSRLRAGDTLLTPSLLDSAGEAVLRAHDPDFGGFGSAPKFPQAMTLDFLMRWQSRTHRPSVLEAVEKTLRAMANGGMYDQVGGGFHRYSTDAVWLVPHFEKMLYDNALLARTYLDAWKLTKDPFYRRIVEETLDYVLREMTDASGGFYSTQDADSEGEEGKFFLWTPQELREVLGEDADAVAAYYGVTEAGNFEGRNILHVNPRKSDALSPSADPLSSAQDPLSPRERVRVRGKPSSPDSPSMSSSPADFEAFLRAAKDKLYAARERRVHPGRDEKVLTAWNGLMLKAFAEAALAFDSETYRDTAVRNADFLLTQMRPASRAGGQGARGRAPGTPSRRLLRTWKEGVARLNGYLEDYACLADGLLALHAATLDQRYLRSAVELTDEMLDLFWDEALQGFFDTGRDHEQLVTRPRDFFDNATPSGTSVAVDVLLRLALLTDNADYERRAATCLRTLAPFIDNAPTAFGRLLCALDFHLSPQHELAIVWHDDVDKRATARSGNATKGAKPVEAQVSPSPRKGRGPGGEVTPQPVEARKTLIDTVRALYAPNLLLVGGPAGQTDNVTPLLDDREALGGNPTAYLCERYVCQAPTTEASELKTQLEAM
jgi:uncharacterized protein YyaL (SSP411 family)